MSGSTIGSSGNSATGSYSMHEVHSSSGSAYEDSTGTTTEDWFDGSTAVIVEDSTFGEYSMNDSTVDKTGNTKTGSYSELAVDTTGESSYETSDRTKEGDWADGLTTTKIHDGSYSSYAHSTSTVNSTGNEATKAYSEHEIDGSSASEFSDSTDTSTIDRYDGSSSHGVVTSWSRALLN